MSDWDFLNRHRVTQPAGRIPEWMCSTEKDGFNGMFRFTIDGRMLRCVISGDEGWQHVSVTIEGEPRPPSWQLMCKIKDLFWDEEEWVCQFHPPKSQHINIPAASTSGGQRQKSCQYPLPIWWELKEQNSHE